MIKAPSAAQGLPGPEQAKPLFIASHPPASRAKNGASRRPLPAGPQEVKAEEVIPFDGDGFEDF
jgi:hypothetical protein